MRRPPPGPARAHPAGMLWLLTLQLYAFDLQIPREEASVRDRCEAAFPDALAQKEVYENRVRVECVHALPGRRMKDLSASFVENCVATTNLKIRKMDGPGRLTIDDELITTMFDYAYTPIFQAACMDRELSKFYRDQGRQSAPAEPSSPRISEVYSNR